MVRLGERAGGETFILVVVGVFFWRASLVGEFPSPSLY